MKREFLFLLVVLLSNSVTERALSKQEDALEEDKIYVIGDIQIVNPYLRQASKGMNGAGFMKIRNSGKRPHKISAASSTVSDRIELHETVQKGESIFGMEERPYFIIPPKGEFELKPKGPHLMFMDLKQPLTPGDHVQLNIYLDDKEHPIVLDQVPIKKHGHPCH